MNKFETTDPEVIFGAIKTLARNEINSGAKRVSVRKLMEVVRGQLKCKINNNDMTAITDRLIEELPTLENLVATRERGNRGRNVLGATSEHNDVLLLARILRNRKLSIKSVTFEYQGNERTTDLGFLRMLVKEAA